MGKKYTQGQAKATAKYMSDKHTIKVVVPVADADRYKEAAKANGFSSLNKFIISCVEKELEKK